MLRIRPAFLAASDRALVVPTVRDRVVHRAVADLLSPKIEPTLSEACRAFRKGSSAMAAADDVGRWVDRAVREDCVGGNRRLTLRGIATRHLQEVGDRRSPGGRFFELELRSGN